MLHDLLDNWTGASRWIAATCWKLPWDDAEEPCFSVSHTLLSWCMCGCRRTRRSTSSLAAGRSVELVLISVKKLESQMWSSCANLRSFRIPLNLRDFAHDIMTLLIFLRLAQDVVSIKGIGTPKNKVFMLFGAVPACLVDVDRVWTGDLSMFIGYSATPSLAIS